MLYETGVNIYNKRIWSYRIALSFAGISHDSFLVNNFADFLDVTQIKKKKERFRSIVGGVSLQQHLLLEWIL